MKENKTANGNINHYDWLDENLQDFFEKLSINNVNNGIITAHGDKCYSFRDKWEEAGIPFPHGVAVYLLSYIHPWSDTCRNTDAGWKPVDDWVIETYPQVKELLAEV